MSGFPAIETCQNQAIMCCFGRDRQSNDNNGDCSNDAGGCDNADPADNSNLCYTKPSFETFPGESEGKVHCHGLAWATDTNDISNLFKYNNFFYVSMYGKFQVSGLF